MRKTRWTPAFVLVVLAAVAGQSEAGDSTAPRGDRKIPLRNWTVPVAERTEWDAVITLLAVPSSESHFISLNPCRVADTRGFGFSGDYGPPALGPSQNRTFIIGNRCGVPATASAVSFNFTVAEMSSSGNLKVYPFGGSAANVSSINWTGSTFVIANAAVVPLGLSGAITVVNESATNTHLIMDVNGYFAEGVVTSLTAGNAVSVSAATGDVTVTIADDAIGPAQLAANSVGASEIAADAVTSAEIATAAVGSSEIADGEVGAVDIGTGAVGADEIAADAVTSAKIATGAVGATEINNLSVQAGDIANDALSATQLGAGAAGNSELATSAVTASKFASLNLRESAGTFLSRVLGMQYTTAIQGAFCASGEKAISWGIRFNPPLPDHTEVWLQRVTMSSTNPSGVAIVVGSNTLNDTYTFFAQVLCLAAP